MRHLERRPDTLDADLTMDEAVQEPRLAWARLRVEGECGLRRGTWSRVTGFAPSEVFLDVQRCPVAVPRRLLELVVGRPTRWSVVPRRCAPPKPPPGLRRPQ